MLGFNRADAQTVAAIQRLKAPEMRALLVFIQNQMQETLSAMIAADENTFRRLQGRAGYIKELLDAVEKSASVMEKQ
jgi:hypothetical protein